MFELVARKRMPRGSLYGLLLLLSAAACATDEINPLGERLLAEEKLGSKPDTATVVSFRIPAGDTSFFAPTSLGANNGLIFGQSVDTHFHAVLRFRLNDFRIGKDTLVEAAELRFDLADFPDPDLAVGYSIVELADSLKEDSILVEVPRTRGPAISTGTPDDTLRTLIYEGTGIRRVAVLDTAVVRSWLQGTEPHPGILMRVEGTPEGVFGIAARNFQETAEIERPVLRATINVGAFSFDTTFTVEMDLTVPVHQPTTQGLQLTDGYVQRIFIPVPVDSINDRVHIHSANLELSIDTSRTFGSNLLVLVYAPDSDDLSNPAALEGVGVVQRLLDLKRIRSGEDSSLVRFSIRNILQFFRDGSVPNNGLAVRIEPEGGSPNMVEFYSSRQSPVEGPRIEFTFSRPSTHEP